ncbi:hypothetical protein HK104_009445 [Borealophlyctis nickersoniae]|nr:hypothetical protein HK104_009445 [Borealophlyctis nickersoniae]
MDTDATTTTTTNNKGNGNNRGSPRPVRCPVCVCKKTFRTARDLEQHLDSGIHDDHCVFCTFCQRTFGTFSGVTQHFEDGNGLGRAQVEQCEKPTTSSCEPITDEDPGEIASDREDSVLHSSTIRVLRLGTNMTEGRLADLAKEYGTIESIEMDPTIPNFAFYDLYYKRFAHILFTSPDAATRAQKAIDGLVVDGRKLVCDRVPDRAYGNIPPTLPDQDYGDIPATLSVRTCTAPVTQRNSQSSRRENVKSTAPVTQRNPQSSRKIVISLQKAVPAAEGDENTINDRLDFFTGRTRTAPAVEWSTASARNPVSQAGTRMIKERSPPAPRSLVGASRSSHARALRPILPYAVELNTSSTYNPDARCLIADRPVNYVIDLDDSSDDEESEEDIQPIAQSESPTTAAAVANRESLEQQMKALPVPGDAEQSLASAAETPLRTRLTVLPDEIPADATIPGRLRQAPARMNRPGMTPVAGAADHNAENDLPSNKLESRGTRKVGAETFTPLRQRNEPVETHEVHDVDYK